MRFSIGFPNFIRSFLPISCILLLGCSDPEAYKERVIENDVALRNIAGGQLPSNLVLAYTRKFEIECPVGDPLKSLFLFNKWSAGEKTLGASHVDYMVCLDLAADRQGALLEAHRILQISDYLPEEYEQPSIIYAASYLAETMTGSTLDVAVGSAKLVELDVPPFPTDERNSEVGKTTVEKKSKIYLMRLQEKKG